MRGEELGVRSGVDAASMTPVVPGRGAGAVPAASTRPGWASPGTTPAQWDSRAGEAAAAPAAAATGDTLVPGLRFLGLYLLALPIGIVALASSGISQYVSGAIASAWLVLAPTALYFGTAARLLPVASALFLAATVLFLPFNSPAFVVDLWGSLAMFVLTMPRRPVTPVRAR